MASIRLFLLLPLVSLHLALASVNLADVPCGKIARGSRRFHARIMGGAPVHITEFAHAVSLRKNGEHFCGGALVRQIQGGSWESVEIFLINFVAAYLMGPVYWMMEFAIGVPASQMINFFQQELHPKSR